MTNKNIKEEEGKGKKEKKKTNLKPKTAFLLSLGMNRNGSCLDGRGLELKIPPEAGVKVKACRLCQEVTPDRAKID